LRRRKAAGQNWLRVLFVGDTDDEQPAKGAKGSDTLADEFDQPPGTVLKSMLGGGVSLPWNLALAAVIGLALLFTRVTLGVDGALANAHHVIGSLVLTVISVAAAEVARPVRWLNTLLGAALIATPFVWEANTLTLVVSVALGLALIVLSIRRGPIRERYGHWSRLID
jgi:hypothetical protein